MGRMVFVKYFDTEAQAEKTASLLQQKINDCVGRDSGIDVEWKGSVVKFIVKIYSDADISMTSWDADSHLISFCPSEDPLQLDFVVL